jgi:hypothetical protein
LFQINIQLKLLPQKQVWRASEKSGVTVIVGVSLLQLWRAESPEKDFSYNISNPRDLVWAK